MYRHILSLATAVAILGQASASCQLSNTLKSAETTPETRQQLCMPQGEGVWTFALDVSEVVVPTFNGGAPWAGLAGHTAYIIYDNECIPRGVYGPSGNDCGTPYVIEDNFLPYVLTVKAIDTDLGGPYFKFAYANGLYSIGNNGCTCSDLSSGLEGEQGCKCAFPLQGEPN
jgi:hypothetical protein